jgi:molybdate transport system substrate-binding protein
MWRKSRLRIGDGGGAMASRDASESAEIKVLTGGAYKAVLLALIPAFERETGHRVVVDNDTVGALVKRIHSGEAFDVAILSRQALEGLVREGKVAPGARTELAKVGVGVMVRTGAPIPDVGTVEAFKQAVRNAGSIGYIDPASGGSSGIYVAGLLGRLGLADEVRGKTRLQRGGHVSDLVLSGEAELGIHQMSEIVATEGVTLAGPLPAEIQNYTTYAAGISPAVGDRAAAEALVRTLAGPGAAAPLAARGMVKP